MIQVTSDIQVAEKWLDELAEVIDGNLDVIVRATAGEVAASLIEDPNFSGGTGTPRDTRRAVNGWNISDGQQPDYTDNGPGQYPEPPDARDEATRKVRRGSEHATIANGVHYIGKLDQGFSRQAPRGFVRRAVFRGINYLLGYDLLNPRNLRGR